jgi:hypothetical protein
MYLFCLPLEHKERRKQGSATIHYHCTQQDLSTMEICLALKHREIRDSGVLERILRTEVNTAVQGNWDFHRGRGLMRSGWQTIVELGFMRCCT